MSEVEKQLELTLDQQDQANVLKFRRMIKESGNELVNMFEFEDEILLRFIRRPKVNLKKSLTLLTHLLKTRFTSPYDALISNTYPSTVQHVFDMKIFGVLKERDQLGRKVFWFRLNRWDPNIISDQDLFRAICLVGWELLASKTTQMKGVVGIFDMSGGNFAHLKVATPVKLKEYMKLYLKCNPFHNGGMHVMFTPMIFPIGFSVFKRLLPKKLRSMIYIHYGKKSLHEFVPAKMLPNFFGGVLTEIEATDGAIVEHLLDKEEYYKGLVEFGREEFFQRHPEKRGDLSKV